MINVPIDKIVPLTTARDTLSKIVAEVESNTPMYVLTKGGKPSVAVVNIDYLEKALNGQLITEGSSTDTSPNQNSSIDQASEPTATGESQTQAETPTEQTDSQISQTPPSEPPPGPPPVEEPAQPSTETPTPPTESTTPPAPISDDNHEDQHDDFWKTPPAPASQPPSSPPDPSSPSQSSTPSQSQNIALGSMDGIQSQPFIQPKEDEKPVDPDMAPPPGQYAGPTDAQTGTGSTGTGNEPADMVID